MKILIYDWGLHIIGGGQKVNCRIAEYLSKNYDVDMITLFPIKKSNLEKFYSLDLSKVRVFHLSKKTNVHHSLLKLLLSNKISKLSSKYDIFINADPQETIKPRAKYNILYCHFFEPIWYRKPRGFIDFLKLISLATLKLFFKNYSSKYQKIYCNSKFAKKWIEKSWKINIDDIFYPFVEIPKKISNKKENIITTNGRLSPDKNFEDLIDVFKKIYDSGIEKYKFIIAATGVNDKKDYYDFLIRKIENYPIEIVPDLTKEELEKLYNKSKIFLMAKGLNADENKYPSLVENFGMSPVEAMSFGCVPIVANKGGYRETVENNKSGFLVSSKQDFIRKIKSMINNEKLLKKISDSSRKRAEKFSLESFYKKINQMTREFPRIS